MPKIAETVVEGYKKIESGVVEGYKKIEDGVVGGYKKIETGAVEGFKKVDNGRIDKMADAVTGAYQKIEDTVVGGFGKMADKFVEKHLMREGETLEDTKTRLAKEQEEREAQAKSCTNVQVEIPNSSEIVKKNLEAAKKAGKR